MKWQVLALALGVLLSSESRGDDVGQEHRGATGDVIIAVAPLPSRTVEETVSTVVPFAVRPEDVAGTLPPPPQTVVLDPGYYGAVTLNHAAHLQRRAACSACHGPGPVHHIERFTAADAHDRCRGCHEQVAKGPTDCRGCHVAPAPPPATMVATEEHAAGESKPGATPGGAPAGATLAVTSSTPPDALGAPEPSHLALRKSVEAGLSVISSSGQSSVTPGAMLGVTLRGDGFICANTLEFGGGRTLGLVGGGVVLPVGRGFNADLQGVGGFDASSAFFANVVPVLGGRAGLEWIARGLFIHSVWMSVTGLGDLSPHREVNGQQVGSFTLSALIGASVDLGTR